MRLLSLLVVLSACGDKEGDEGCAAVESGSYDAAGSCFGMSMSTQLTFDADGCSFTLGAWSMEHGNEPTGGSLSGDEVVLEGGDFDGCTGTLEAGVLSGVCTDGCAWEFVHAE